MESTPRANPPRRTDSDTDICYVGPRGAPDFSRPHAEPRRVLQLHEPQRPRAAPAEALLGD